MNELIIKDIVKKYKKNEVLSEVSLNIKPGIFGLLGPNGAGKTTLIRILATILRPSKGSIQFNGVYWKNSNDVRELIGYLPQKFSLYKTVKVYEVLRHIGVLKDIKKTDNEVERVLDKVNLFEERNKRISQLSGGMLRRVGIAQAIMGSPAIIIVDEPTAGLDPEERIRFRNILAELDKSSIVIISTHIVEDVESTCSNLAIMNKGKIITSDELQNVVNFPQNKVWKIRIAKDELMGFSDKVKVISYVALENDYIVRYIYNDEIRGAESICPTLEDSYMYLLKSI